MVSTFFLPNGKPTNCVSVLVYKCAAYHCVLIVDFATFYAAAETFHTIVLSNCPFIVAFVYF